MEEPDDTPYASAGTLQQARHQEPAPVTLEWDLSNRCPWGCLDCHFAYTHTKGPRTRDARQLPMAHDRGGDLADTVGVVRVLGQVADAGVKSIVWTGGGEPTVHPDFLYIVRHAHALGLELVHLETLGFLGSLEDRVRAFGIEQAKVAVDLSCGAFDGRHRPDEWLARF